MSRYDVPMKKNKKGKSFLLKIIIAFLIADSFQNAFIGAAVFGFSVWWVFNHAA